MEIVFLILVFAAISMRIIAELDWRDYRKVIKNYHERNPAPFRAKTEIRKPKPTNIKRDINE